jgi:hypothetical protein
MNMLKIGMLFGSGIELGIGIDMQPDIDTAANTNNAIKTAILTLFFNFEVSPANLYYAAQYQGFSQAFPGAS